MTLLDLLAVSPPDALDALPLVLGGVFDSIKKAFKKVTRIPSKLVKSVEKRVKKVEQTLRPALKLGVVAAASYYGGPMGGQIAAQAAFGDRGGGGEAYAEPQPYYDVPDGAIPYTSYSAPYGEGGGTIFEAMGAPLGLGGGGDEGAAPSGVRFPPWAIFAAVGAAVLILFVVILRR